MSLSPGAEQFSERGSESRASTPPEAAYWGDLRDLAAQSRRPYDGLKRAFDILGSLFLFVVLLPLFVIIPLLVRLTSKGPALFSQRRLTEGGRVFVMWKFRTMRTDAESASGPVWAASGDSRVTAIGRYLRVTRIDELPQLYNVLVGDMSLIGPRPERPEFADQLVVELPDFPKRLAVKAGLTGLAQISAGYASCIKSYRRKLQLDLIYIEKRSILLDLKIAVMTVLIIFTGTGAR